MTRLCELSFICVWTSALSFSMNKIEPTQVPCWKIDLEVGLDCAAHIEKVQDHLALGPVGIPARWLRSPGCETQGVFDGARQLGHFRR